MRTTHGFVAVAMVAGTLLPTEAAMAELRVWTTVRTEHVLRSAPPGNDLTVSVSAARNQWRSFQVLLRADRPVKPGKRPPPDAGNEKFSLVFSGSRAELLPQDTYAFDHQTLGRFDVFIVPVNTRNPAKIDYQAVVNRLPNSAFQTHT